MISTPSISVSLLATRLKARIGLSTLTASSIAPGMNAGSLRRICHWSGLFARRYKSVEVALIVAGPAPDGVGAGMLRNLSKNCAWSREASLLRLLYVPHTLGLRRLNERIGIRSDSRDKCRHL